MSFYVRVGSAGAFVHRAECAHCNAGRGIGRRAAYPWVAAYSSAHFTWLGPFRTCGDAMRRAEESRGGRAKLCGHCFTGHMPNVVSAL